MGSASGQGEDSNVQCEWRNLPIGRDQEFEVIMDSDSWSVSLILSVTNWLALARSWQESG